MFREARTRTLRGSIGSTAAAKQTKSFHLLESVASRILKAKREDEGKYTLNLEYVNYYYRDTDSNTLTYAGQVGLFGKCKGDCDDDSDCAGTLVCYQRDGDINNVPGCEGLAHVDVDYCIPPENSVENDEQRQEAPATSPTTKTTLPTSPTTDSPTRKPVTVETAQPTMVQTASPTSSPTGMPVTVETAQPTPTMVQTSSPTSTSPTNMPVTVETAQPTTAQTASPTSSPTGMPVMVETAQPTTAQTASPTSSPTATPTGAPTLYPSPLISSIPSRLNTWIPSSSTSASSDKLWSSTAGNSVASISKGGSFETEPLRSSSLGGLAIMGFAFLSLFVLAILGLAISRKRKNSTKDLSEGTPSTVIVPYSGKPGGPRWGDGSTMNQLTRAFEGENGIEVVDMKSSSSLSIRSAPSADSFSAEPAHLPYDSSLHDKYPRLFGLPEPDPDDIGEYDTVEL